MKYLSVILMTISLQACTAPKVITPEINRKSYQELRETQPDCTAQIAALQAAEEMPDPKTGCSALTSELILDALYCYRSV